MRKHFFIFFISVAMFIFFTVKLLVNYGKYESYQQLALQNVIHTEVDYADRGVIFDRNHKQVVDNKLSYSLMVLPSEVSSQTDTALICTVLNITRKEWKYRLTSAIKKNGSFRESVFFPFLDSATRFGIQENLMEMKGFFLKKIPIRNYLYPAGFHVFGYTAEVSKEEVGADETIYSSGSFIGKNGLEKHYDAYLRGVDGKKLWAKNNKNAIVQPYDHGVYDVHATSGYSLVSTIDIELQTFAESLMKNKRGAIVALDPKTGEVLCLVSAPMVNPLQIRQDNRQEYYSELLKDHSNPLINRVVQGRYSPGSAFKVIEALIAVNQNVISPDYGYNCRGVYLDCIKPIRCEHSNPGHASNLNSALTYSCNSYFIDVFRKIWAANKRKYPTLSPMNAFRDELHSLGVGVPLGIDLAGETKGFVPDSAYYTRFYGNQSWGSCTVMSLGIGQGELLLSPLQLANTMAILANGGYFRTPHLVSTITNYQGAVVRHIAKEKQYVQGANQGAYDVIVDAMRNVVERGTASGSKIPNIAFFGKTGTVENYTIRNNRREKLNNHSIFAGFALTDTSQICIAVVVENGGFGASVAAPIASLVVEKYIRGFIADDRQRKVKYLSGLNLIPSREQTQANE